MALFTSKADKGLSRLTRFYQLELPPPPSDDAERDGWAQWGEQLMSEGSELAVFVGQECINTSIRLFGDENHLPPLMHLPRSYAELGKLQLFLKKLMGIAADNKAPDPEEQSKLNEYIRDLFRPQEILWIDLGSYGYKRRYAEQFDTGELWERTLERPLLEDFVEALVSDALVRCEECQSVFPKRKDRKEQRHCSQRCRSRVGNRRRYQLLFGNGGAEVQSGKGGKIAGN